jgi:hypothetical protein
VASIVRGHQPLSTRTAVTGSTILGNYTYLDSRTVVQINYPQPTVQSDLYGGTTGTFNGLGRE